MKLFYKIVIAIGICPMFLYGQSKNAYLKSAEDAMSKSQYGNAIYYYEQALTFPESNSDLMFRTAKAYRLYKAYDQSIIWYEKGLSTKENLSDPSIFFDLGTMYMCSEQYIKASEQFDKALTLEKDSAQRVRIQMMLSGCILATDTSKQNTDWLIEKAGSEINSIYSDFAAHGNEPNEFWFTSLKFTRKNKNETEFYSKLLQTKKSNGKTISTPADFSINKSGFSTANSSISNDQKILIYTRCKESDDSVECWLYESTMQDNRINAPTKISSHINRTDAYQTHPFIINAGAKGYLLYFSSNRPGGYGGMDIWYSTRDANGQYSEPINAGSMVNTAWDEITPFYDAISNTLYFSSNGHPGFGSFDVFSYKQNSEQVQHLGRPINSGAEDIFYNHNTAQDFALITSNRKGSNFLQYETCCYDIYLLNKDTTQQIIVDTLSTKAELSVESRIEEIKKLLPIQLYFHNDIPDPGSKRSGTTLNYIELFSEYTAMQNEYQEQYGNGLSDSLQFLAVDRVNHFFENDLRENYNKLEQFMILLEYFSDHNFSLNFKIRGQASPLADSDYNNKLSSRRISSFMNYLNSYKNGIFSDRIVQKQLVITQLPSGESLSDENVSDRLDDLRNSIYSPAAARERKIEIIDLIIEAIR
ncbi:MAG TPA: hypothetical protein PKH65_06890 [Bacteroidia bacterium]|nr:hypothetical protein [Bacteroidia bacterium]HNT80393.1 hypothetical protein [Bacteroidia bacterium]